MKTKAAWPAHPDGQPKKMREMSADERHLCVKLSVARLKAEFENPSHQTALADALSETIHRMRQ